MLKIVEILWAVGALPRTLLGELTALPTPIAGGNGVAAPSGPSPKNPTRSISAFGPSVLPPVKNPEHALAYTTALCE